MSGETRIDDVELRDESAVGVQLGATRGRRSKVTLVRPPFVMLLESSSILQPTPPVGVAYIAGALRDAGHDVQMLDAPSEAMDCVEEFAVAAGTIRRIGLTPELVVERIRPGTELIGITNMFAHEWPTVREIAIAARRRFPDALIVVGGENATSFWPWMFEQTDAIDAVVLGEGESAAVEIASRVASGGDLSSIEGVALRAGSDGAPESTGLPTRIRDMGSISTPAWDLFDLDPYFRHRFGVGVHRGRTMPILATRGCPYKCTFCSSPNMWTTRYTVREPTDVVDEIESYVDRYGINNVDFVDLTPMTKRSWILALCDELEARGLAVSLQLPIGTRSEALDYEVLERMAAAGTTNITFAPETGSPRMLEIYDKRLDLDHVLKNITAARRAGLITNIHMILGHPQERWVDRWHNWTFMMRAALAGLHVAGTTLFYPYPGSKDFQTLLDQGKIVVDDAYCYDCLTRGGGGATNNWNPQATVRQLHVLQLAMVGSFTLVSSVLHPGQVIHLIRSVFFDAEQHTWLEEGLAHRRKGPMSRKTTRRRKGSPRRDSDARPAQVAAAS